MVKFSIYLNRRVFVMDAQNAKMSGLNQHKDENVGFVSNLTSVCASYFNFFLALSKENSFLFFLEKRFCTSPHRLVVITIFLTLPCLLMLITAEACKQMLLQSRSFAFRPRRKALLNT